MAALVFLKVNGNKVVKNISIIKGADVVEIEIIEYSFYNKGANIKLKQKNEMYEIQSDWSVNEKIMQMSVNQNNEFAKIDKIHNFNKYSITIEDCSLDLIVSSLDTGKLFKYMPEPKVEDLSKMLISPMPGLIKDISVKEGQKIKKGEQIVIIEAMKMENILKSEKDCLVREILVKEGDSVSADEVLINFE